MKGVEGVIIMIIIIVVPNCWFVGGQRTNGDYLNDKVINSCQF